MLGSGAGVHYGLPGFRTAVTSPAQGDDWFSKFKRWRLAKAVRLIKELEIYRNFAPADRIRQWLIGIQPGIAPLRRRLSQSKDFVLLMPPGWQLTAAQRKRLQRLLARRQARTCAQVVSCDDWLPLASGKRLWRQKGQLDPLLDRVTGEAEGPLWIQRNLLQELGEPPEQLQARPAWRDHLFETVGAEAWAHVALPLAISPPVELPPAQAAQPKGSPLVSVLIPSGGFHKPMHGRSTMLLRHSLTCLLQRSDYRELEIVLIDGGELNAAELEEFENSIGYGLGPGRWRHARSDLPYSYSQRINQAAAAARGEFLLQLNDDTELLEPGAIGSMLAHAQETNIGVVGALLLYPGGRVQHAGVAVDNLAPRHAWVGCWPKRLPPGLLAAARQFQAVTAAVSLCSAELWQQLGGLRDDLPINYGDVDFCLRARQRGHAVVLDPASRWTHFESASRSTAGIPPELTRFRELWSEELGGRWCIDPYVSRWRELMLPKR
ncbi:beta-glycosyltransferase/ family 2 [Synechococcus sp. Minos11]|nr:beta-glycosyltransferase/ family 2 [Synechococcus sp. Minos11]